MLVQARSVEIVRSDVGEEQWAVGEEGGCEAEAELGGAVGEF